jgi:predicted RNA-binding protein Jag
MSEVEEPTQDKRERAEEVLGEILRLMGIRARLEVKDLEATAASEHAPAIPASISVALHLDEQVPGVTAGKRSGVIDALQFLSNKIVNRGPEKRWINIGLGAHPEPRVPGRKQEKAPRAPPPPSPPPQAPKAARVQSPAPPPTAEAPPAAPVPERPSRRKERGGRGGGEQDERTAQVTDDPALASLGRMLSQKAAEHGRVYAVLPMTFEDRARLLRAGGDAAGVTAKVEGEGRHRRVVFLPQDPKPMPKLSALPDYDDEDELEE